MSDFREVTPDFLTSPQIGSADLAEAVRRGCTMVINNRPDGEAEDQPEGADIAQAAQDAGLGYLAIPIDHSGFSDTQVALMEEALAKAQGPVLAYCRSGTRSTLLWALAQARAGRDPAWIAERAWAAGYNVTPVAAAISAYANKGGSE